MTAVKSNSLERRELINTTVDAHPMHLHFAQFQILDRQAFDVDGFTGPYVSHCHILEQEENDMMMRFTIEK